MILKHSICNIVSLMFSVNQLSVKQRQIKLVLANSSSISLMQRYKDLTLRKRIFCPFTSLMLHRLSRSVFNTKYYKPKDQIILSRNLYSCQTKNVPIRNKLMERDIRHLFKLSIIFKLVSYIDIISTW